MCETERVEETQRVCVRERVCGRELRERRSTHSRKEKGAPMLYPTKGMGALMLAKAG